MRDETDGLNLCIPGLLETSSCGLQRRHGPLCPVPVRRHCPVWSLKVDEQTKCNLGECQVLRRALVPRQISELGKVPLTSILEAANRAKKKMNGSRPCGGLMGGGGRLEKARVPMCQLLLLKRGVCMHQGAVGYHPHLPSPSAGVSGC